MFKCLRAGRYKVTQNIVQVAKALLQISNNQPIINSFK